jgi:hypothetical protein
VVSREVIEVVRACQARVACALGGGAASSGAMLAALTVDDLRA